MSKMGTRTQPGNLGLLDGRQTQAAGALNRGPGSAPTPGMRRACTEARCRRGIVILPGPCAPVGGYRAPGSQGSSKPRGIPTTSHNVAATDCKTYTLEKKSRYTPYLSPMASRRRGIDAIVRKSSLTGANRNLDRHSREDQDDTDSLHAPVCSHVPLGGCHEVMQYLVQ